MGSDIHSARQMLRSMDFCKMGLFNQVGYGNGELVLWCRLERNANRV